MKPKILKDIRFEHSVIMFWQLSTFEFLPHVNITIVRANKYFELQIGWLFWHFMFFK